MARISTTDSIAQVDESRIQRLTVGRSFYVSQPWLLSVERLRGDQVRYLMSEDDDGSLLGLLPVYDQKPVARGGPYDVHRRFLGASGGLFRDEDWSPALVLGQNSAFSAEFLLANDLPADAEKNVLLELLGGAESVRRETASPSVAALYLNENGSRQLAGLDRYEPSILCGVDCEIAVAWNSWDDYLRHLGKRATVVRRERSTFEAAGYTVTVEPLSGCLDASLVLFSNLQRKYGDSSPIEARARYLQILVDEVDSYSRLFVMRRGEVVLGVCLAFEWEKALYIRQFGLDYDAAVNAFEYFNVTIYEPVRYAVEHGLDRIHFGRSTYTGRMLRGAAARPLAGVSVSAVAGVPGDDQSFRQWNAGRLRAVRSGSHAQITETFRGE
ncbi:MULTISPECIES: GNAT family N-acetyltransferase [Actinomycetes]|uniref:GNAT family N-acetyltransferase n=1 Tax=Actinomycetes TaxID=1760 RepID=UPI0001B54B70|nr:MULTISPECIES: GNAT family N-acetyltransferase [Actinomycetes]EFL09479.1 predicted protein [Streptomyces sp. AA4]